MFLGLADHLGWAVAVISDGDHRVVVRRRIELVEPGITPAPIHYDGAGLDPESASALVADVEGSVRRATIAAFDELAGLVVAPILVVSLRAVPDDFPTEMATLLRPPWEARADAVMYRRIAVELAEARGWAVRLFEAKTVERVASELLGDRADEVLRGPRAALGPPWAKDHRMALAANVLASAPES